MNNHIVWLTGVPAVGKTTIAEELKRVAYKSYDQIFILDADICRKEFWPDLGLSEEDRHTNISRIGHLGKFISEQAVNCLIIIACISPYDLIRSASFLIATEVTGRGCMVYLYCPLEERIRRDPKGLYKKALNGEIVNLTGYDGVYEEPTSCDIRINTGKVSPQEAALKIFQFFK